MSQNLWKYATTEKCNDFLLSFKLLGETKLSEQEQLACLYSVSNTIEEHYKIHVIPKQNGGYRRIAEPDELLKAIQRRILKNILSPLPTSTYALAYKKNTGLVDNALPHVGQKQLLKLDIEDFFDSISFSMVYQRAFSRVLFPEAAAGILTSLCCHEHCLPQGAPTSPFISNLVLKPFDDYIGRWCEEREICYTRFCDDMTFSGEFDEKALKNKVQAFLDELGFSLNRKKSRLLSVHDRQIVTGVVVNQKAQVSKRYRKDLRKDIYYCLKYGVRSHLGHKFDMESSSMDEKNIENYILSLLSKISFVLQINPGDNEFMKAQERLKGLLNEHRKAQWK